jgi:hypothetical protein
MKRTGWFNEEGAKKYKEILSRRDDVLEEVEKLENEIDDASDELGQLESEIYSKRDEIGLLIEKLKDNRKIVQSIKEDLADLDSDDDEDEDAINHYENQLEDLESEIEDISKEMISKKEELDILLDDRASKRASQTELERRLENIERPEEEVVEDIKDELECLEIVKQIDTVCENDGEILVSESFKASKMYNYIFHHEYLYTGREARDLVGCDWRTAIAGRMRIFPVRAEEVEQFPDGSIRCAPYVFEKENIFGDFDGYEKGFILSFQNPE